MPVAGGLVKARCTRQSRSPGNASPNLKDRGLSRTSTDYLLVFDSSDFLFNSN